MRYHSFHQLVWLIDRRWGSAGFFAGRALLRSLGFSSLQWMVMNEVTRSRGAGHPPVWPLVVVFHVCVYGAVLIWGRKR